MMRIQAEEYDSSVGSIGVRMSDGYESPVIWGFGRGDSMTCKFLDEIL